MASWEQAQTQRWSLQSLERRWDSEDEVSGSFLLSRIAVVARCPWVPHGVLPWWPRNRCCDGASHITPYGTLLNTCVLTCHVREWHIISSVLSSPTLQNFGVCFSPLPIISETWIDNFLSLTTGSAGWATILFPLCLSLCHCLAAINLHPFSVVFFIFFYVFFTAYFPFFPIFQQTPILFFCSSFYLKTFLSLEIVQSDFLIGELQLFIYFCHQHLYFVSQLAWNLIIKYLLVFRWEGIFFHSVYPRTGVVSSSMKKVSKKSGVRKSAWIKKDPLKFSHEKEAYKKM